jgi:hypothetical protein
LGAFSFTAPSPPFGGPVTGETHGGIFFQPFVIGGTVKWDSPIQVAFGVGGLLGIQLSDTTFGLWSNGQPDFEVKATFTLLALSTKVVLKAQPQSPVHCHSSRAAAACWALLPGGGSAKHKLQLELISIKSGKAAAMRPFCFCALLHFNVCS